MRIFLRLSVAVGLAWIFASFLSNRRVDQFEPTPSSEKQGSECFTEEEVVFESKSNGIAFSGTLTMPRGTEPFPTVLLICGGGPIGRENAWEPVGMMSLIAHRLAKEGIASMRYDKRGVGKSGGTYTDATLFDFADDACAAFSFLQSHPLVDNQQIGVLGHSQGGHVALILASEIDTVAFAVFMGTSGRTGEKLRYDALKSAYESTLTPDQLHEVLESFWELNRIVWSRTTDADALSRAKTAILKCYLVDDVDEDLRKRMSAPERCFQAFDPVGDLRHVRCPVLALYGEKDQRTQPKYETPIIGNALRGNGNPDVTITVLPNLNHVFQECKTGSFEEMDEIEEIMNRSALDCIEDWIRARVQRKTRRGLDP